MFSHIIWYILTLFCRPTGILIIYIFFTQAYLYLLRPFKTQVNFDSFLCCFLCFILVGQVLFPPQKKSKLWNLGNSCQSSTFRGLICLSSKIFFSMIKHNCLLSLKLRQVWRLFCLTKFEKRHCSSTKRMAILCGILSPYEFILHKIIYCLRTQIFSI